MTVDTQVAQPEPRLYTATALHREVDSRVAQRESDLRRARWTLVAMVAVSVLSAIYSALQ